MKKNTRRNQQGFTLIELLVVIAILAVLFGVTALALNGVGSNAEQNSACAERDVVQTAIDVKMAQTNAVTVTLGGPATVYITNTQVSPYLRRNTKFQYSWTGGGLVGNTVTNTNVTPNHVFSCP